MKILKCVLFSVLTLQAFSVQAGSTTAKIAKLLVVEDSGLVYVYPEGGVQGAPSCHGSNGNYYSFSMTRPFGKIYYATLLAAKLSGSLVFLYGKGACLDQSLSETLSYVEVR